MGAGDGFQSDLPGIEIELYQRVARNLALDLRMIRLPWKRCLKEVADGQLDGIFPASFKPERLAVGAYPLTEGRIDASRKSRDTAYFLYRAQNTPVSWNGSTFIHLDRAPRRTIGVPMGWSIVTDLRKLDIDILERPRPLELLKMLNGGGLAGVVCLDTVADTYLRENRAGLDGIEKVKPAVANKSYYLMLSHQFVANHPVIAEKIWDAIAKMRSSSEFDEIVRRYTH